MLLLENVHRLHARRWSLPYPEYARAFVPFANALQYEGPEVIKRICGHLREEITKFAYAHSKVYRGRNSINKGDLANKDEWYVPGFDVASAATSGSSTGQSFTYLRWNATFNEIEANQHYLAVLREFNQQHARHILYFMLDRPGEPGGTDLVRRLRTTDIMVSHGLKEKATVHEVIKNFTYYFNYHRFYEDLFEYLSYTPIDVVLAPAPVISALAWQARRLGYKRRIAPLLSTTGEKPQQEDLDFFKNSGLFDHWCDHMRCWDGGVTFYSCQYGVRHLIDGLAWAEEHDGKLVSTDYYSLPSPFVSYWNGDQCRISEHYQRCACGRHYREFKVSRTRPFSVNGLISIELAAVHDPRIKRMEADSHFLRVFTTESLESSLRSQIRSLYPNVMVNFITEEANDS
jgi:hypothetical protein